MPRGPACSAALAPSVGLSASVSTSATSPAALRRRPPVRRGHRSPRADRDRQLRRRPDRDAVVAGPSNRPSAFSMALSTQTGRRGAGGDKPRRPDKRAGTPHVRAEKQSCTRHYAPCFAAVAEVRIAGRGGLGGWARCRYPDRPHGRTTGAMQDAYGGYSRPRPRRPRCSAQEHRARTARTSPHSRPRTRARAPVRSPGALLRTHRSTPSTAGRRTSCLPRSSGIAARTASARSFATCPTAFTRSTSPTTSTSTGPSDATSSTAASRSPAATRSRSRRRRRGRAARSSWTPCPRRSAARS